MTKKQALIVPKYSDGHVVVYMDGQTIVRGRHPRGLYQVFIGFTTENMSCSSDQEATTFRGAKRIERRMRRRHGYRTQILYSDYRYDFEKPGSFWDFLGSFGRSSTDEEWELAAIASTAAATTAAITASTVL